MTIDEWILLINAAALICTVIAEEAVDATYPFWKRRRQKNEEKKHNGQLLNY